MSKQTKLKRGTEVWPSTTGHYGFYYPKQNASFYIKNDLIVEKMGWVTYGGFSAYKVVFDCQLLKHKILWIK